MASSSDKSWGTEEPPANNQEDHPTDTMDKPDNTDATNLENNILEPNGNILLAASDNTNATQAAKPGTISGQSDKYVYTCDGDLCTVALKIMQQPSFDNKSPNGNILSGIASIANNIYSVVNPPKTPTSARKLEYANIDKSRDEYDSMNILRSFLPTTSAPSVTSAPTTSAPSVPSAPYVPYGTQRPVSISLSPSTNRNMPQYNMNMADYIEDKTNRFSSSALDVLAIYIKGQKLLYTESKTYCEQQLNFLMLPAIFISCVSSIFSFMADRFPEGALIIASLNGFNAFLLALISYLKLDAKAQAHKTSAYKFDKLESYCEFNSGKLMFLNGKTDEIAEVIKNIEKDVKDIKETNQFILPESIRYEFSFTYSTNIFMLVKKIQSMETDEKNYLTHVINQLNLEYEMLSNEDDDSQKAIIEARIRTKEQQRAEHIRIILECREKYFKLDERFNHEIEKHIRRSNRWLITRILCCDWLKS